MKTVPAIGEDLALASDRKNDRRSGSPNRRSESGPSLSSPNEDGLFYCRRASAALYVSDAA